MTLWGLTGRQVWLSCCNSGVDDLESWRVINWVAAQVQQCHCQRQCYNCRSMTPLKKCWWLSQRQIYDEIGSVALVWRTCLKEAKRKKDKRKKAKLPAGFESIDWSKANHSRIHVCALQSKSTGCHQYFSYLLGYPSSGQAIRYLSNIPRTRRGDWRVCYYAFFAYE